MYKLNFILLLLFFSTSCIDRSGENDKCHDTESDSIKISKAENECSKKTSIDELRISFFGYFSEDVDSIQIKIKRSDTIAESYTDVVPQRIQDSLRHLREYKIDKQILLTDTVFLKIKNEPVKKVYGFKYFVRPHFTMYCSGWGCDFYELIVNEKVVSGQNVDFMKKGWDIIEYKDFKQYYYSTLNKQK